MPTYEEMWPQVTGSDVLIWAAMDRFDTSKRIAIYKNRAGIKGRLTQKQLNSLGETMESLPAIKKAADVATALRAGYPPQFRWDYFDLILSSSAEDNAQALTDAVQQAVDTLSANLSETKAELVAEIASQVASVFRYKGSVDDLESLPTTNNVIGDVYQVIGEDYTEYCWIETDGQGHWEYLGKIIDLTPYLEKSEYNAYVAAMDARVTEIEVTKQPIYANVFIRQSSEVTLSVKTKYYVKAKMTGMLPSDAEDGDEIVVVVLPGGEGTTIEPSTGITINGSSDVTAFNVSIHQSVFVFDASNSDWICY